MAASARKACMLVAAGVLLGCSDGFYVGPGEPATTTGSGQGGMGTGGGTGGTGPGSGGTGAGAGTSVGGSGGAPATECGNGEVEPDEECDDGGSTPGDGCSAGCEVECAGPEAAKHPVTHHCYTYMNGGLVTWDTGRGLCLALGSGWELAIITSAEERNFLDDVLALPEGTVFANDDPYQYWLGGRDLSQQDVFEWLDGEPWSYAPWDTDPPDPSNGSQDCIRIRAIQGQSNDVFRDAVCGLTSSVLCELQPAGT